MSTLIFNWYDHASLLSYISDCDPCISLYKLPLTFLEKVYSIDLKIIYGMTRGYNTILYIDNDGLLKEAQEVRTFLFIFSS